MTLKNSNLELPHSWHRERQIPQLRGVLALLVLLVACIAPCLGSAQNASVRWQYLPLKNASISAYSPDGSMIAVCGAGSIQIFDATTGAGIQSLPTIGTDFVTGIAFSPDSKTLFDAGQVNNTYWLESWSTTNWALLHRQSLQGENPNNIAVSPDGSTVAVGGAAGPMELNGFLELHSASDLSLTKQLQPMQNTITIYCVSYSPDGTKLVASGATQIGSNPENGSVQLFDLTNGSVSSLSTGSQWTVCVAFSPDGKMIADGGGGYDGSTRVYYGNVEVHNLAAGTVTTLPTTMSGPVSIQFSPNEKNLLVGGSYLSIVNGFVIQARAEIWNLATAAATQINTSATTGIGTARYSPSGNAIELTGQSGPNGNIGVEEIWSSTGQSLIQTIDLGLFASGPSSMSFSPDGKWLTYSGANSTGQPAVGLFNASTGQAGMTFPSTASFIGTTAMSSDGVTFADGGYNASTPQVGKFELWNASSGALIASLPTKASVINQVAFSPDGKTVAGAGLNVANGIEFWNVSNATLKTTLPSIGPILGMAYSPDGTMLTDCGSTIAGLTQTGYVEVWTLASKQKITINSACSIVNSVAFSPDGTMVADTGQTPAGNYILEVWNDLTGAQIMSTNMGTLMVCSSVAFTPDGSTIFVGTSAGLYAVTRSSGDILYNNGLLGVLSISCLCVSPDGQLVGVGGTETSLNGPCIAVLNNPLVSQYLIKSLTFNPAMVTGGTSSTGTVTIAQAAPAGGLTISLSAAAGVTVPGRVVIPAGQTSTTFNVSTSPVSSTVSASITASYQSSTKTSAIIVNPPTLSTISLNPGTVIGGNNSTGTVTLNGPAPSAGIVVNLSSSSSYASVPTTVTVLSGATSANFSVTTQGVSATITASITATNNGFSGVVSLTITPASLSSITFSPSSVVGGNSGQGIVTLNGKAPSGGIAVSLASSNVPKGVSFPASVTIPAGSSSAAFQVTTKAVKSAESLTLNASFGGKTASATLAIQPATLQSVSVKPASFFGGQSALGTVTMTGNVATPLTIKLSSSSSIVMVPSSVTISANENFANFAVISKGVTSTQTVTVTAEVGSQSMTCQVTVKPAYLSNITLTPSSVPGGMESIGTVYLVGVAPIGGFTVNLGSSAGCASVPSSVKIPAGKSLASFTIKTAPVTSTQNSTISARLGTQVSAGLTVTAPTLKALTLSTTGVVGGQKLLGTITMSSVAPPGGISVNVSSNTSLAVAPHTVMVPAGKSTAQFTIKTKTTSQKVKAIITASYGGVSESASFSIRVH